MTHRVSFRLVRILAALLTCSALLGVGPAAAQTPSGAPIKLGISGVMSGPLSVLGQDYREGATLAVNEINAKGGVLGRPLQLFPVDNAGDPAQGVTAAQHLIDVVKVAAFIGSSGSSVTLAVMPVIERAGIVQLTVGSTNPKISQQAGKGGNIWQYRLNIDDAIMARAFSDLIATEVKSVAIVGANNDYGRGAAEAFRSHLTPKGIKITNVEYYTSGQPDYRPMLTKIKAAAPEGLIVVADAPDAAPMAVQHAELGMTQKIYGRGSVVSTEFRNLAKDPKIWDGAKEVNRWAPSNSTFEKNYEKVHGRPPRIHAALPYYGIQVLAEAIRIAGSDERKAIRDALEKVSLTFPELGPVKFDEFHQARPDMFITQFQDGKVVTIGRRPTQ
jgi:branched-chain amino acid transport system substrate-binding protein